MGKSVILGWVVLTGKNMAQISNGISNPVVAGITAKLEKKHLDMIAANSLNTEGAGFGVPTNVVTLLTPDGAEQLPLLGKDEVAARLLDAIEERRK